jgi:alkyl sulfatase BDS1-like metallo-beta-lactamase superfamily hydrolase
MNPSNIYELPPSSVYPDLVRLAGGPEAVVRLAVEKMDAGKPVETLRLTDVVLASDPNNHAALSARLKALENLREHTENYVEAGMLERGITTTKEQLATK